MRLKDELTPTSLIENATLGVESTLTQREKLHSLVIPRV
jgi:hypothetical protein